MLAASVLGGMSCTKGTGPEIDATIQRTDARGSGDAGTHRDAGADGPGSDAGEHAPGGVQPW